MKVLTLDLVRMNFRMEISPREEKLAVRLCECAEDLTEEVMQNEFTTYNDANGNIPVPIIQACIMLAAQFFEYYKFAVPSNIYDFPFTYAVLLEPYSSKGISNRLFNLRNEMIKRVGNILMAEGLINVN